MTHFPSATTFAIAEILKSVPPDERETVCADAIALLAEQERREAEDKLLIAYGYGDEVRLEDRARLQQDEDGDESL
jgi:hypothetical protein